MINVKGDKTPVELTANIKNYAEALPPGLHMMWSATSADIDVTGQPVANTGFIYEVVKQSSSVIQIKAIPFSGNNTVYLLRKHGSTWRPWVEFSGNLLGGG